MIRAGGGVALLAALAPALVLLPAAAGATSAASAPAAPATLASPAPAVQVIPPMCPVAPLSLPAFLETLRVELAGNANRCCDADARDTEAGTVRVALAVEPCDAAAGHVIVTANEAAAGRSVRREIALDDVARDARPRALALAVAELVRSVRAPAPAPPSSASASARPPASPPPSAPAAAVRAARDAGPRATLAAGADAELRLYPSRGTALWGGRLSLSAARGRWQAAVAADAAAGDQHTEIGSVALRSVTVGIGAGPRFALPRGVLTLGLGAEVGWAWIAGAPDLAAVHAGTGSGPTAAIRAQLGIEVAVAGRLRLGARVEAGYTAVGLNAYADGAPAGGISGASLLAAVGVGLADGP